jgi:hypothetical protein
MAVLDFNADEKYRAYHILACLNRSFLNIFNNLGELKETGILSKTQLNTLRGISQELQADVNFHALETLQTVEEQDWGRFGKARADRGASVVPRKSSS